jgi:CDP-diacylglycerol--glycerol-3-phosphate 3-phosphatidyltransferase
MMAWMLTTAPGARQGKPCTPLTQAVPGRKFPLEVVTTANKVTVGRILLVPFFVIQVLYYERTGEEWHRLAALLTFALATLTDAVDGYIARRYNQYTELGALLDPVADKILLVSALVLLTFDKGPHLPNLPLWLAGTVIGRDMVQAIGLAVTHYTVGKVPIRPRLVGKAATLLLMVTIIWALLKWDGAWLHYLAVAAAVCTGISGVLYVLDGMKLLGTSPDSTPKTVVPTDTSKH